MEPPNLGLRCIGLSQYNIGFWRTTLVYNSIELVCGSLTLVYDTKTFVYDCRISSGSLFSEQLVHLIFTRYSWVRIRGKSLVFQKGATTADCLRTVCRHILASLRFESSKLSGTARLQRLPWILLRDFSQHANIPTQTH